MAQKFVAFKVCQTQPGKELPAKATEPVKQASGTHASRYGRQP
jgi:hypothetical protein